MVSLKATFAGFGAWLLFQHIQPALAQPSSFSPPENLSHALDGENGLLRRADPQDFYLRIMPLGASITAGARASPKDTGKNGFRKFLREKLRLEGWKVNMVGNFKRGSMDDNDHEGVAGQRVSQVHKRARPSLSHWQPNVVLINAGTNDANQNGKREPLDAVKRNMRELIDDAFSRVPDTVVVLSTLIPGKKHPKNIDYINDQYRALYREYIPLDEEGNEVEDPPCKLILAEMNNGFITIKDIHDGIHPTVEGHRKMATVWDRAINKANEKGWLSPPIDSSDPDDENGSSACCHSSDSPLSFSLAPLSFLSLCFVLPDIVRSLLPI